MKFLKTVILVLLFIKIGLAQPPCLPTVDGIPAGDEPPGCFLCSLIYQGTTIGYSADTFAFDFPCGTIDNSQWINFKANATGRAEFSILPNNCLNLQGVQMAIYDQQFNIVSNCFSPLSSQPGNVIAENLIPSEIYLVMIDGVAGDECDFLLTQVTNGGPPDPSGPITVDPPVSPLCPGAQACYSISPVEGADSYEWTIPANSEIVSGGEPSDTIVCVEFTAAGGGTIQVTPQLKCFIGVPSIEPVIVLPIIPTFTPPEFFCPEVLPENTDTCYQTALGCDSCITRVFIPLISITTEIDTTMCPGDFFEFNGQFFDTTGITEIIDPMPTINECDSITIIKLTISDLESPSINCLIDTFTNSIGINWTEPAGAMGYYLFINDSLISTQNHSSFLYSSSVNEDSLKIRIAPFNSKNCAFKIAETTCFPPNTTSTTSQFNDNQVKIFPNPTTGIIEIKSSKTIEKIAIFDLAGRFLFESFDSNIDLSNFDSGLYFLKIKTARGISIKKTIKL